MLDHFTLTPKPWKMTGSLNPAPPASFLSWLLGTLQAPWCGLVTWELLVDFGCRWAVLCPGVLDPGLASFLVSPPGPRPPFPSCLGSLPLTPSVPRLPVRGPKGRSLALV